MAIWVSVTAAREEISIMSDAINKCNAQETAACCCVDVGTVMDNTDCTASYSRVFANQQDAEQTLAALTEKARGVESDPCDISSSIKPVDGGVQLDVDFTFSCQAETMIFQLGLR
ncbi:YfcZ/YiiS family protein [Serratia silvae]